MSDFLEWNDERFDSVFLHEMIHIYFFHINSKEGHGRNFMAMAQKIGAKAGVKITKTEDISQMNISSDIKSKEFVVLLLKARGRDGYLVFSSSVFERVKDEIYSRVERYIQIDQLDEAVVVRSSMRELILATTTRKLPRSGLRWYLPRDDFNDRVFADPSTQVVKKLTKGGREVVDSKVGRVLNVLSGKLVSRLERRYPGSRWTLEGKQIDLGKGVFSEEIKVKGRSVVVKISGRWTDPDILDEATVMLVPDYTNKYMSQHDKYPTPATMEKLFDRAEREGLDIELFSGATVAV